MDKKEIGHRMQALRKERGLTMRELAERTGLSQGQVSRLENGRQGFRSATLMRLAEALGVRPYRLYLPEAEEKKLAGAHSRLTEAMPGRLVPSQLTEALKQPDFVAVVEEVAKAYGDSPERFHAIESVIKILLDGAGSS